MAAEKVQALTRGRQARKAPKMVRGQSSLVSAPTTVNCFASLKEPSDRLCITTAFYASIDCVPDGERPTVLRALLASLDDEHKLQITSKLCHDVLAAVPEPGASRAGRQGAS